LASFFTLLYAHGVRRDRGDKLWWTLSHKGMFNVSSFYRVLACKDGFPFCWKSIWWTKVILIGKILTMDNLRKRREDVGGARPFILFILGQPFLAPLVISFSDFLVYFSPSTWAFLLCT
jgi:hypothetical protein